MKKNSHPPKRTISRALAVMLITSIALKSRAEVNTREGNFKFTWYDSIGQAGDDPPPGPYKDPTGDPPKDIRTSQVLVDRTYNSRSHHRGIFGFRWCSSLDKILEKISDSPPTESCPPEKTPHSRLEIAFSKRLSSDRLLIRLTNQNTLLVVLDLEHRVIMQIQDSHGNSVHYTYNRDNLLHVDNKTGGSNHSYNYDLSHNLVDINENGLAPVHIDYDLIYDRVTMLNYGDGCIDGFSYDRQPEHTNRFIGSSTQIEHTTVTRTCRGSLKFSNTYEFTQRRKGAETAFRLIKFRILNPMGVKTEVSYD